MLAPPSAPWYELHDEGYDGVLALFPSQYFSVEVVDCNLEYYGKTWKFTVDMQYRLSQEAFGSLLSEIHVEYELDRIESDHRARADLAVDPTDAQLVSGAGAQDAAHVAGAPPLDPGPGRRLEVLGGEQEQVHRCGSPLLGFG